MCRSFLFHSIRLSPCLSARLTELFSYFVKLGDAQRYRSGHFSTSELYLFHHQLHRQSGQDPSKQRQWDHDEGKDDLLKGVVLTGTNPKRSSSRGVQTPKGLHLRGTNAKGRRRQNLITNVLRKRKRVLTTKCPSSLLVSSHGF